MLKLYLTIVLAGLTLFVIGVLLAIVMSLLGPF